MPTPPGPDWPDVTERDHWTAALANAAERVERDRGVVEPWRLEVGYGRLWASYGGNSTAVAGPAPDVLDPQELFEDIDSWVAFERPGGPGRVLDRDLAAMAQWRAQLPALQRMWEEAASRVFLDVRTTTQAELDWRVAVHEEEVDWSRLPGGGPAQFVASGEGRVGGVIGHEFVGPDPWPDGPPTRPAAFPQIHLETRTSSGSGSDDHLGGADDLDDAVLDVAGTVQDLVIEEVHGAWPTCPGHWHPMQPGPSTDGAVWHCPDDDRVAVPIGRLVELLAPEEDAPG